MARSVSGINPDDVFPPRNLPGTAETWGRVVEDREIALEKAYIAQGQSIDGLNRNLAASQQTVAGQIGALTTAQDELSDVVDDLALTQADLVTTQAIVAEKVTTLAASRTLSVTGTGAGGASNVTIPSVTIPAPSWATTGYVLPIVASISGTSGVSDATVTVRLSITGGPIMGFGSNLGFKALCSGPSFVWTVDQFAGFYQKPTIGTVSGGSLTLTGLYDHTRAGTTTGSLVLDMTISVIWIA